MVSMNANEISGDVQEVSSPTSCVSAAETTQTRNVAPKSQVECNNNNNNKTWKTMHDNTKMTKLQEMVENTVSGTSKGLVESLLQQINQLSDVEKFLLYLKLPVGRSTEADPLKQSLNPLGSRSEIQLTITWMKTHLEEDVEVSLPKEEVYNEYVHFSTSNGFKALSTADFGKVMKQVFPSVRARRLGHRGASKYCHSGLKKKYVLDVPALPDLSQTKNNSTTSKETKNLYGLEIPYDDGQKSSLNVVMEWAEKLCNTKFSTFCDLAMFLLNKSYVSSTSVPAFTLLALKQKQDNAAGKHREAQLNLQKKLQEREQKRKLQEHQPSLSKCSPERPKTRKRSGTLTRVTSETDTKNGAGAPSVYKSSKTQDSNSDYSKGMKGTCDLEMNLDSKNNNKITSIDISGDPSMGSAVIKQEEPDLRFPLQGLVGEDDVLKGCADAASLDASYCLDDFFDANSHSVSSKTYYTLSKFNVNKNNAGDSVLGIGKYKPIQPKMTQYENNAKLAVNDGKDNNINKFDSVAVYSTPWSETRMYTNDGASTTKPHEIELAAQYSQKQVSSSQVSANQESIMTSIAGNEVDDLQKSDQLTELRKLLQKNLPAGSSFVSVPPGLVSLGADATPDVSQECESSAGFRRRVSFQTSNDASEDVSLNLMSNQGSLISSPIHHKGGIVMSDANCQNGSISQGPSQASSANASPFMSPRNTPLLRSRHNSGQANSTYVTQRGGAYVPDNYQNNSMNSENSSPFMSPAPTPLFSRSRHNSSQSVRTNPYPTPCRSRHNSGAPNYRHAPYVDDYGGRRGGKYRASHSSGSIPTSCQSAPLSPLIHEPGLHPLADPPLFHQYHMGNLTLQSSIARQPVHSSNESANELRRRHMSAGPTIHYQPLPPSFQNSHPSNICNDPLAQEISNVMNNTQNGVTNATQGPTNRPQSVPLPQMQNSSSYTVDFDYLAKSHPNTPLINQNQQFLFGPDSGVSQHSGHSSYAPTPVPSEYNDFSDYANLELENVLASETSTINSGFESIDSFTNLTGQSDASSTIPETYSSNLVSCAETSNMDAHFKQAEETASPYTQLSSKSSSSIVSSMKEKLDPSTKGLSYSSNELVFPIAQRSLSYNGSSQITLNALNSSSSLVGFNVGDAGFDNPTSHFEDNFQDDFKVDFVADPDAFNSLVLDVNKG